MQPTVLGTYTPLVASTTYFANDAWEGAGPFVPTTTTVSDGLAHQVTLTVATSDYSAINFTLTGLDANGDSITEVLAGPNNNTVTSVNYFSALTQVTVSAPINDGEPVNKVSAGIASASFSPVVPLDARSVSAALIGVNISGTINYTISETADDVFVANPSTSCLWVPISALASKTGDLLGSSSVGARGVQLKVNSLTSTATIKVSISQASSTLG